MASQTSHTVSSSSIVPGGADPPPKRAPDYIDPTSPEWRCAICHASCTQQCSLCKEVAYCGKDHQREDWKWHKLTCRGNIPTSDLKCKVIYDYDSKGVRRGRNLITTKAIKQGEILLKELPLVWVPKQDVRPQPLKALLEDTGVLKNIATAQTGGVAETSDELSEDKPSACIVCGDIIPADLKRTCSLCHWPVCSEACERNAQHEKECEVFQANHIPRHIQQLLPNRFLFVLRSLLLQSNEPKKWKHLMELEYNPEEMTRKYSTTELFSDDEDDDAAGGSTTTKRHVSHNKYDVGIAKLLKYYGIKCEVEWVTHLMKVIKWNVIYDYEYDSKAMLFHLSSAAKHSCLPNAEAVFKKSDMRLHIRALVDLKPGEGITISKDPLAIMLTAQVRQRRLKYLSGWDSFRCNCARCSDWTELGTNFATLQCRKELKNWSNEASASDPNACSGILCANRPLDQNFEWKCSTCKFRVSGDLNQDKLGLKNLLSQVFHYADADPSYILDGIKTVESFLHWFHPSHSFILQTKLRIMDTVNLLCVNKIMSEDKTLERGMVLLDSFMHTPTVETLLQYGADALKIADAIFPGSSRVRGHILQFLGFAKWTMHQISTLQMDVERQPDFIQYSENHLLGEAREHLSEAQKILMMYKDVKEDEHGMYRFAYFLSRRIDQMLNT